jgi:hypothetical protein
MDLKAVAAPIDEYAIFLGDPVGRCRFHHPINPNVHGAYGVCNQRLKTVIW